MEHTITFGFGRVHVKPVRFGDVTVWGWTAYKQDVVVDMGACQTAAQARDEGVATLTLRHERDMAVSAETVGA